MWLARIYSRVISKRPAVRQTDNRASLLQDRHAPGSWV
jgi:hypothetical protein